MSGWLSRIIRKPVRTISWSSAMTTLIAMCPSVPVSLSSCVPVSLCSRVPVFLALSVRRTSRAPGADPAPRAPRPVTDARQRSGPLPLRSI